MPSPFPGMDPYIEDPEIWSDFHNNLAPEIQSQLNRVIRPRYVARLIPHVSYEVIEVAQRHHIRPDLGVWQRQPPQKELAGGVATMATAPVESLVSIESPLRYLTIEIQAKETLALVTAIEILSPVNKNRRHEAYQEYLRKRRDLLRSSAHLLELDLLRAGERPPLETPIPPAPYYVTLSRVERRPTVEVWPIQLWDGLPIIPVPLSEPDPDTMIDLAAACAAVYERGGYDVLIDYHRSPPAPKLDEATAIWLDQHLHAQGVR